MPTDAIPLTLLTGFLGSGKTTLLNRLLPQAALGRCAVVINELGAIGLDHLLVSTTRDETIALLENGCLCCSVRGELAATIATLFERRARGEIPVFERLLVETTGLARPGPVVSLLLGDEALAGRIRLDGIVAAVEESTACVAAPEDWVVESAAWVVADVVGWSHCRFRGVGALGS